MSTIQLIYILSTENIGTQFMYRNFNVLCSGQWNFLI